MPPLFRFRQRKVQVKASLGRWPQLLPTCLLAMATGVALIAWTGRAPTEGEDFLTPAAPPVQGRGLRALTGGSPSGQPLTVPPPVLPQPLPPHQAWPDLPLVQAQPNFTDLDPNHWAWPILSDLAQRDLWAGFPDGSFRPTAPMTRAEFAAQIARLFNFPQGLSQTAEDGFYTDIAATHWAYDSIQKSVQMGFLSGYPDDTFLPDQTVSRIHVIVALANGLMLKSSSGAATALAPYGDRSEVPPWATRQLVAATEAGLVVNYPDLETLAPNQTASRAEVAAMLHRALVHTGTLQEVALPYIAGQPAAQ